MIYLATPIAISSKNIQIQTPEIAEMGKMFYSLIDRRTNV